MADYIHKGLTITPLGGLKAHIEAGRVVIGGTGYDTAVVRDKVFTASKDIYVDVGTDSVIDYNEVVNNAAAPSLAANHIRIARVVTGADAITLGGVVYLAVLATEAWIAPTLTNLWVNYGGGFAPAGFYKDGFERVYLRGLLKAGTLGQAALTLPAGCRPAYDEILMGVSDTGATVGYGEVRIYTTGAVVPQSGMGNTWFSLSGITFRAA
ncbi:MAG: hypothetical protein WC891_03045 [Actinomycetota bacterium]